MGVPYIVGELILGNWEKYMTQAMPKEKDLIETLKRLNENVATIAEGLKYALPMSCSNLSDLGNRLATYSLGMFRTINQLETTLKRKL